MWIYMVYSQGPETLYNGIPKMYVIFFTPRWDKTVVIIKSYIYIRWELIRNIFNKIFIGK